MLNKIIKSLRKLGKSLASAYSLDVNEIRFMNNWPKKDASTLGEDAILFQAPMDYYYLCHFGLLIKQLNCDNSAMGVWPYNVEPIPRAGLIKEICYMIYSKILYSLNFMKWGRLYRSIGIKKIIRQDSSPVRVCVTSLVDAYRFKKKIHSKEELLKIHYHEIYIGDLIYDTYLRFRSSATVDLKDWFLTYVLYKAFISVNVAIATFDRLGIKKYFSSYSSYTHHGIFVRVALLKNIDVYVDGNVHQYLKKLSSSDNSHGIPWREALGRWDKTDNKSLYLTMAQTELSTRFSGMIDSATKYMKQSAFNDDGKKLELAGQFDGVIFLHDFFDSPHGWGDIIFCDFWEWACFTLEYFEKSETRVAVKPHPNQIDQNSKVIDRLKEMFPGIKWLDPSTSNSSIFSSGIKFGVSVYGTVLYELAYHGIIPIAAGVHPALPFDFVFTPDSKAQYVYYLEKWRSLKMPSNYREKVLEYFASNYLLAEDGLASKARDINLKEIDFDDSSGLIHFLNRVGMEFSR